MSSGPGPGPGSGSQQRQTLETAGINDEAEFGGYSKIGLLVVFSPMILSFTYVVFYSTGGTWVWGMVSTIFFGVVGLATVSATPDDESLLAFVSKYARFWTRQTPYIHQRRRHKPRDPQAAAIEYAKEQAQTRTNARTEDEVAERAQEILADGVGVGVGNGDEDGESDAKPASEMEMETETETE